MQSAGLGWREILASLTTAPAARFGDVRAFTNVRYAVRAGRVIYSSSR